MKVLNYTEFRDKLAKTLDMVNDDVETIIVSRSKGRNAVFISLKEYDTIMETLGSRKGDTGQKLCKMHV